MTEAGRKEAKGEGGHGVRNEFPGAREGKEQSLLRVLAAETCSADTLVLAQ